MHLSFQYSLGRDAHNLLRGLQSVNSPQPSKVETEYLKWVAQTSCPTNPELFIQEYIRTKQIDVKAARSAIATRWTEVNTAFVSRAEQLFQCRYPARKLIAYLTIDSRCTYNTADRYFYVSLASRNTNLTVMHELFHFYTQEAFHRKSIAHTFLPGDYNTIKEALTELLNVLFADLLNGSVDKGYPQHAALRSLIRELWSRYKDLYKVLEDPSLIEMLISG